MRNVQNLCEENHIVIEGHKENLSKWRAISYYWLRRLNIIKMSILPK